MSSSPICCYSLRMLHVLPVLPVLQAVNQVLYERHGYRRQRRHGNPLE